MGRADFGDADKIIWKYQEKENHTFEIITSKYWIDKEDIEQSEYEADIRFFEEKE
jgi:hypothetical protein